MATPLKKKLPTPPKKAAAKAPTGSAKPAAKKASTYVAPKPLPVAKPIAPSKPAAKATTMPPAGKVFTQSSTAATKPAADKIVGIGHNGGPTSVSKTVLKSVVDRIENLEEDKQGIADDIKEVYTEAKAKGLDVKTIRKIVAARRRDKEKLRAEKELMDIYLMALDPELAEVLS